MTLVIPALPSLPAGHVVTVAEMNQLSAACTFLLTKPVARVHDGAGAQAIGTGATTVSFNTKDIDTDGMWSAGTTNRLTVQTPGWYKVHYGLSVLGVNGTFNTGLKSTTGSNNPLGAGVVSALQWPGYTVGSATVTTAAGASGVWPFFLYIGDFIQLTAFGNAAGGSTDIGVAPSFLDMEFVST